MVQKQVLLFQVENYHLAVDITHIKEVIRMVEIQPIPKQPRFVEGIVNFRGTFIPIIDLKERFLLDKTQNYDINRRIVVVHYESYLMGLLVDQVLVVSQMTFETHLTPYLKQFYLKDHFIEGVTDFKNSFVVLFKVNELFNEIESSLLRSFLSEENGLSV